jgi:hypothetical protein
MTDGFGNGSNTGTSRPIECVESTDYFEVNAPLAGVPRFPLRICMAGYLRLPFRSGRRLRPNYPK